MAVRKQLKGLAHGLLGTFVSPNNDINGYWGIGVLNLYSVRHDLSTLVIDLIGRSPSFVADSPVQFAEKTYQRWLFDKLAKVGIDRKQLESAEIHLRFSTFDEFPNVIRDTRGEPLCVLWFLRTITALLIQPRK